MCNFVAMKNTTPAAALLFAATLTAACQTENSQQAADTDTTAIVVTENDDWVPLFDGRSLDAWRNYRADTISDKWQVQDGMLTLTGKGGGDIITKDEYENFELELEWKISEGGNSGIFFNVVENDSLGAVYLTGPEMQILDDERHPDAKAGTGGNRTAGSNYDLMAPSQAAKPAGAWNQVRLVVDQGLVTHYLNGTQVVAYDLNSDEWKQMVAKSKFVDMPAYGLARRGHIALQDHGDQVWFRNIRVREL